MKLLLISLDFIRRRVTEIEASRDSLVGKASSSLIASRISPLDFLANGLSFFRDELNES